MTKVYCSEAAFDTIYDCMRVVGIASYTRDLAPLEKIMRDAMVRAHRRTLRPRRALAPAPLHLGPHLVVHRLERHVADSLFAVHRLSWRIRHRSP